MAKRKRTDKVVEDTGCTEAEYEHMFEEEALKNPAPLYVYNAKDEPTPLPPIVTPEEEIQKIYGPLGQGNVTGILHAILSELVRARLERGKHV